MLLTAAVGRQGGRMRLRSAGRGTRRAGRRTAAAAFVPLAFWTGVASALEGDPFGFYVGGGLSYDNNLLRLPSNISPAQTGVGDRPRGAWIGNAFVRGTTDLTPGRQRIRGYIQGNAYRYDNYSYLNWEGVDFGGAWLWELGNRWNGNLSYDRLKFLSGLADLRALIQNLRTVQIARADAEYWLHPNWRLTGGYTYTSIDNSAAVIATTNVTENSFGLGFKYITTERNFVIFGARYTDGDYPNRSQPTVVGDTGYKQYDVGADIAWAFGGNTDVGGRLAYTERKFPNLTQRNFAGPTGNIRADWRWTGKTGVSGQLRREIGGIEDVTANYILTSAVRVAPYWLITEKTRLDAYYEYQVRDYRGEPGVAIGLGPQRRDTYNYLGLNASWSPTRNWQLGLGLVYSTRRSNVPDNDFNDLTALLTVRFGI